MKLETAINLLRKEYEKAVNLEYVRKPLAYALYHTWRQVDRKEKEREK